MLILVLSQDGQSISGFPDTLSRGLSQDGQNACNSGSPDKGDCVECMLIPVLS